MLSQALRCLNILWVNMSTSPICFLIIIGKKCYNLQCVGREHSLATSTIWNYLLLAIFFHMKVLLGYRKYLISILKYLWAGSYGLMHIQCLTNAVKTQIIQKQEKQEKWTSDKSGCMHSCTHKKHMKKKSSTESINSPSSPACSFT